MVWNKYCEENEDIGRDYYILNKLEMKITEDTARLIYDRLVQKAKNDHYEELNHQSQAKKRKEHMASFNTTGIPSVAQILENFDNTEGQIDDYFGFPMVDLESLDHCEK